MTFIFKLDVTAEAADIFKRKSHQKPLTWPSDARKLDLRLNNMLKMEVRVTRKTIIFSVLVASRLALGAQSWAAGPSAPFAPIHRLEESAAAQNAGDETSVAGLVDAVLDFPHSFEIPAAAKFICGPRLKAAQKAYLLSPTSGIHERDVVSLVNELANSLRLPAFAQVTSRQVRVIRVKLVQDSPALMGRGFMTAGGQSVNPYMSPVQAVHLILMIADQKLLNDEYQVEPAQWETDHEQRRMRNGPPQPALAYHYAIARGNQRGAEMRRNLNEAFKPMTPGDLSDLAARCLAKLGM